MEKKDIQEKILLILEESSGIDKVDILKIDNLVSNQIIDSLGMIEMISCIENDYQISFSENDLIFENFESVDMIVDLINLKLRNK